MRTRPRSPKPQSPEMKLQPSSRSSMRCDIRIAQNIRLKLKILKTVLDDIADADDPDELVAAKHRQVPRAITGHQAHHAPQAVLGSNRCDIPHQDVANFHGSGTLAMARKSVDDVAL